MDAKKPTPRNIIIKMLKVNNKERILKVEGEEELVTYRRVPIRLSADFLTEIFQAKRDWQEIFKVRKAGNYSQDCSIQQSYHLESKSR